MTEPIPLRGGVNQVLRVGLTVHRPTGPWTPAVHGLLRHLEHEGFTASPRVHGTTPDGLEILDHLPGEVGEYPLTEAVTSTEALRSAAELLRAYHDVTAAYVPGHETGWMFPAMSPAEVVLHNDYAPYNCVLDGTEVVGVIDFDTATPGPRLWDVAYATYRWAPITAPANPSGFGTPEQQATRTRAFCDHYGLRPDARRDLVDTVIRRLDALVTFMRAQADAGVTAFQNHIAEGHDSLYLNDITYLRDHRHVFDEALRAD
ncbi:aminoglycoside phosphotransferase family protein [Sphaerisporangium sp. B11E5]|uniref:aminoglycoside phosphotransferase family protein n=1 Tax=Sphaerisporangium sp. B11E5 TaxID=3153563 RepID=UPI00325F264E